MSYPFTLKTRFRNSVRGNAVTHVNMLSWSAVLPVPQPYPPQDAQTKVLGVFLGSKLTASTSVFTLVAAFNQNHTRLSLLLVLSFFTNVEKVRILEPLCWKMSRKYY